MDLSRAVLVLFTWLSIVAVARGAGPADALFRLVPPNAGVAFAVEDLRAHSKEYRESPLAAGIRRLPAVRDWLASGRFQSLKQVKARFESAVGESVSKIRDELLGDAVVLSLHLPENGRQDEAKGLLLAKVRDRPLLDRLISGINTAQSKKGELDRIVEKRQGDTTFWLRKFAPACGRPDEYYTILEATTFAWSNSESMIRGVIDRKAGRQPGLGDDSRFRRIRDRLPGRSFLSIFVNPRFLETMMASSEPDSPKEEDRRILAWLGDYLGALDYAGLAVELRDGLIVHTEESVEPEKFSPHFRPGPARAPRRSSLGTIPADALVLASLQINFETLHRFLEDVIPDEDRPQVENLRLALDGILLGHDLKAMLPHLGPDVTAHVEARTDQKPELSVIVVVGFDGPAIVGAALDNAFRTVLAVSALDKKAGEPRSRFEASEHHGVKVGTLRPTSPFAYGIGPDRLIVSRSVEALIRSLDPNLTPNVRFERLRSTYFSEFDRFLCADLGAIHQLAKARRDSLARLIAKNQKSSIRDAAQDLDRALALLDLFQSAFAASSMAPDARSVHRVFGLITSAPAPKATTISAP
ncbi:hypothetical protein ACYOEI_10205 [Singulisphaera rosea]